MQAIGPAIMCGSDMDMQLTCMIRGVGRDEKRGWSERGYGYLRSKYGTAMEDHKEGIAMSFLYTQYGRFFTTLFAGWFDPDD